MPVYEYGCDAGHHFEVKQKMTDAPIMTCQVCSLPVSKLISAPAISFKGSGWYVTDYSDKMKPPGTEEKSDKPVAAADPAKKEAAPSTAGGGEGGSASPSPPSTPTTKPESTAPPASTSGTTPASSTGS
jgi:putative FmdB family regulatory protein